jgi:hypothetical protein
MKPRADCPPIFVDRRVDMTEVEIRSRAQELKSSVEWQCT